MPTTSTAIEVVVSDDAPDGLVDRLEREFAGPPANNSGKGHGKRGGRRTVLPEQAEASERLPEDTLGDRPAHIRQRKRLGPNAKLDGALRGLRNALDGAASWWEVRVHECQHDLKSGTNTAPCDGYTVASVDGEPLTNGNVPDRV